MIWYILAIALLNICLGYALAVVFGQGIDPRQLFRDDDEATLEEAHDPAGPSQAA